MDFNPQTVRSAGFKTVKKGYDPVEVDAFKEKVAASIEAAQNQATAMEARARAAVAKLQELSQQVSGGSRDSNATSGEDVDTISRTLLLAQRTADSTIAQANTDAAAITEQAGIEATTVIDNAKAAADQLLHEARLEARRSAESERIKAENEVQALLARRDFLLSDVDHLEQHLGTQRERLRDAAVSLQDLVERVPGGLGELRRPLLSASATTGEPSSPAATVDEGDDQVGEDDVDDVAGAEGGAVDDLAEAGDASTAADHDQDNKWRATGDGASILDDTPIGDSADADEAMRLDLHSSDRGTARPSVWSASGSDPLIGGDELR